MIDMYVTILLPSKSSMVLYFSNLEGSVVGFFIDEKRRHRQSRAAGHFYLANERLAFRN